MQDDLRYITFKQFIYTVNIRRYDNEKQTGTDIRIYPDNIEYTHENTSWFDLCWYDWFNKDAVWNYLNVVLSEDVLNSYVSDIWLDENEDILSIRLVSKPTESLLSLKN
jgi:hypothetical protein